MNYLYFAEAVVETGDDGASEALMVPAANFVGADPVGTTSTAFYFKNAMGNKNSTHKVVLTHGTNKNKSCIANFVGTIFSPHTGGFIVVADAETGTATTKSAKFHKAFGGNVTACAVTESHDSSTINGVSAGTTVSTSYGTGAVGTDGAPQYTRTRVGDIIKTTVKISLNGLKAKGGHAGDAIGVGTTPAYIYKNVVAENGVIFKQRLVCLETAAEASGTLTDDVNVAWNSAATIDYDEAVGTGSEVNAGDLATGGSAVTDGAVTANHYAYLTEGGTEASDCVYNGGCYLLEMWGAASL